MTIDNVAVKKGFFASLFDFSFESFVTPTMIKIIYGLVMVIAGLTYLVYAALLFKVNAGLGILWLIIPGPIVFFLSIIFYRIFLEVVMAIFAIARNTDRTARVTASASQFAAQTNMQPAAQTNMQPAVVNPQSQVVQPNPPTPNAPPAASGALFCINCGTPLSAPGAACSNCGSH